MASYRLHDSGNVDNLASSFNTIEPDRNKNINVGLLGFDDTPRNIDDHRKVYGSLSNVMPGLGTGDWDIKGKASEIANAFYSWVGIGGGTRQYVLPFSIAIRGMGGDGATKKSPYRAISFLINPNELTKNVSYNSDSSMTRGGHVVVLSGRNQMNLSIRGTFPAYYGPEGLSSEVVFIKGADANERSFHGDSAGFLHRLQVLELMRDSGYIRHDLSDLAGDSRGASFMSNRSPIYTMDGISVEYDGVTYIGNFTSFSVDESASTPYLCHYNMEFTVSSIGDTGFSGHFDCNPSKRTTIMANQDDIVDAQTLKFSGLKVPVPVGTYTKDLYKTIRSMDPSDFSFLKKNWEGKSSSLRNLKTPPGETGDVYLLFYSGDNYPKSEGFRLKANGIFSKPVRPSKLWVKSGIVTYANFSGLSKSYYSSEKDFFLATMSWVLGGSLDSFANLQSSISNVGFIPAIDATTKGIEPQGYYSQLGPYALVEVSLGSIESGSNSVALAVYGSSAYLVKSVRTAMSPVPSDKGMTIVFGESANTLVVSTSSKVDVSLPTTPVIPGSSPLGGLGPILPEIPKIDPAPKGATATIGSKSIDIGAVKFYTIVTS